MYNLREQTAVLEQMVADLLKIAQELGATAAEAAVSQNAGLSVNVRMGQVETVEHVRDRSLGVTVYFGTSGTDGPCAYKKGSASTTDFSAAAVRDTVAAACKIACHTQDDPCAGLADAALLAKNPPDLDLYHPWQLEASQAIDMALRCEAAALELDPRLVNSEGAAIDSHEGLYVYGNSNGFIGGYPSSHHGLSCAVLGQDGDSMQRDYWWTSGRAQPDLESEAAVGRKAGLRTLARLGARRLSTRTAPIVFQADVAVGLLHNFISAITGHALYRRASFLLEHLGRQVFPEFVHIHENPLLPRGVDSAPFDHEGVATKPKDLVVAGVLQSYVLDSYAARKLGLITTGNAGGVHNLTIDPGQQLSGGGHLHSPLNRSELQQALGTGLWITELMGQGANNVTGDYSRGAAGFWIENGEIAYPVEEITIAGNLKDMFMGLQAVGCDVDNRTGTSTGSWLLAPMTIAGT